MTRRVIIALNDTDFICKICKKIFKRNKKKYLKYRNKILSSPFSCFFSFLYPPDHTLSNYSSLNNIDVDISQIFTKRIDLQDLNVPRLNNFHVENEIVPAHYKIISQNPIPNVSSIQERYRPPNLS